MTTRTLRAMGIATLVAALALGFLTYLQPGFMVDLSNMVLAWCS